MLFKRHEEIGINRIYSIYGNIHLVPELIIYSQLVI